MRMILYICVSVCVCVYAGEKVMDEADGGPPELNSGAIVLPFIVL